MSIATNARQRADWLRKAARIQGELADLRAMIDVAMRGRPMPGVAKLMAAADVHVERSEEELSEAAQNIGALP